MDSVLLQYAFASVQGKSRLYTCCYNWLWYKYFSNQLLKIIVYFIYKDSFARLVCLLENWHYWNTMYSRDAIIMSS